MINKIEFWDEKLYVKMGDLQRGQIGVITNKVINGYVGQFVMGVVGEGYKGVVNLTTGSLFHNSWSDKLEVAIVKSQDCIMLTPG